MQKVYAKSLNSKSSPGWRRSSLMFNSKEIHLQTPLNVEIRRRRLVQIDVVDQNFFYFKWLGIK